MRTSPENSVTAKFAEIVKGEVRSIDLPHTSVHKPRGNTPDSSRWHHVLGVEPVEKAELARVGGHSFYAILDPESGHLLYANAGHDLPYLWHSGECEELRARGMPLGLMPQMSYEEKEIVIEEGDSALLYH